MNLLKCNHSVTLVLVGVIQAVKNIWIISDGFLTDAVAVLGQMQVLRKDDLYMYQEYDVYSFYPKKLCNDTFGKVLRSTLGEALGKHNKLPSVMIIVVGNSNIDDKVTTNQHTRRVWTAICNEIDRSLKARKDDLPKKACVTEEPRVYITNIPPRHKDHGENLDDGFEPFKTKRRRLNNILPQVAEKFNFSVLTITGILPDNVDLFVPSTGSLNGKGMEAFWNSVSRELRLADDLVKQKYKNLVIQRYLEDKQDEKQIRLQKGGKD